MSIVRKHKKQLDRADWLWEKACDARKKWDRTVHSLVLTWSVSESCQATEQAELWATESREIREKADLQKREAMAKADEEFYSACSEARKLYK